MDVKKIAELQSMMTDPHLPVTNRQQAAARYEQALEDTAREFDGFLERIKINASAPNTGNESANIK